jgi:hypothetical protein
MRTTLFVFVSVLAAGSLPGCGTVSGWMPTNPPPHPLQARPAEQVELFTSATPTRDFVEVGLIEAAPSSGFSRAGDFAVLQQLRTEAGARGCDGLVVNGESKSENGSNSGGTITVTQQTLFRAACIVYR